MMTSLATRTSVTTRTAVLIALGGTTTASLAFTPGLMPLLIALAILAGVVRGDLTLLHATAVTNRRGTTHYGRLSGLLGAPAHIAAALAPWAGAALAGQFGDYSTLFAALACTSILATVLAVASATKPHPVSGAHPG
ncbi:hypothetical protein ACH4U5_34705 [Streptomyces sp. NPDC020858]|uniref:hypothetical protein n=1 Tax=Streptomyces sp. NPDC020858 TaxID=3365097 RepID=UPI00379E1FE2